MSFESLFYFAFFAIGVLGHECEDLLLDRIGREFQSLERQSEIGYRLLQSSAERLAFFALHFVTLSHFIGCEAIEVEGVSSFALGSQGKCSGRCNVFPAQHCPQVEWIAETR